MKRLKIMGTVAAVVMTAFGASGCLDIACLLCCGGIPNTGRVPSVAVTPGAHHARGEANAVLDHTIENVGSVAQKY